MSARPLRLPRHHGLGAWKTKPYHIPVTNATPCMDGEKRTPGEFRRSQNWIGGARPGDAEYAPPHHHRNVAIC